MAIDKLVDSSQLDTDLTAVADAIRAKGGTSGQLTFPAGFVSAVQAIPTGGGEPGIDDFSGGNILAIIGNGSEYIETDYLPPLSGVFCTKLSDSNRTRYQHYWGATQSSNRIGMQVNDGIALFAPGCASTGYTASFTGWSRGSVITPIFGGSTSVVATKPLVFFRGYYNGSIESSIARYTFYGLNIMTTEFEPLKKYRPWLDNGVACIKELVSGIIYHNSGSGEFKYIDVDGVVHNA